MAKDAEGDHAHLPERYRCHGKGLDGDYEQVVHYGEVNRKKPIGGLKVDALVGLFIWDYC